MRVVACAFGSGVYFANTGSRDRIQRGRERDRIHREVERQRERENGEVET